MLANKPERARPAAPSHVIELDRWGKPKAVEVNAAQVAPRRCECGSYAWAVANEVNVFADRIAGREYAVPTGRKVFACIGCGVAMTPVNSPVDAGGDNGQTG